MSLILDLCLLHFCWNIQEQLIILTCAVAQRYLVLCGFKCGLLMVLPGWEMFVLSVHQFSWFLCAGSSRGGMSKDS